jgi:hypothetical protein
MTLFRIPSEFSAYTSCNFETECCTIVLFDFGDFQGNKRQMSRNRPVKLITGVLVASIRTPRSYQILSLRRSLHSKRKGHLMWRLCLYVCQRPSVCVCVCVCVYIYIYIYIYVRMYIYIYISARQLLGGFKKKLRRKIDW